MEQAQRQIPDEQIVAVVHVIHYFCRAVVIFSLSLRCLSIPCSDRILKPPLSSRYGEDKASCPAQAWLCAPVRRLIS
jgi:hypothetical protein